MMTTQSLWNDDKRQLINCKIMSKKRTKAQKKKVAQARANLTSPNKVIDESTVVDSSSVDNSKSSNLVNSSNQPVHKTSNSNQQFASLLATSSSTSADSTQPTKPVWPAEKPIIRTEHRLIKKDLLKSLLVSLVLLGLLLGIYLIARYNVISLPFLT